MKNTDDFVSHPELSTEELKTALLIENGTIEAYEERLDKSKEFWKAVENKVKIERALKEITSPFQDNSTIYPISIEVQRNDISKLISKTKYQNKTSQLSFETPSKMSFLLLQ